MGDRIENVGKPPCFNGFQVTLNMLKATFWIPAEPTWDSKVCAAPRSKGHFAEAVRCRPVSIRKPPGTGQRRVVLDFRPAGERRSLLCSFFLEGFLLWFSGDRRGEAPAGLQEGSQPPIHPIHPRIPPTSLSIGPISQARPRIGKPNLFVAIRRDD